MLAKSGLRLRVIVAMSAALFTFGVAAVIVRLAPEYTAVQISTVRTVFAALFLAPVFFLRDKKSESATPITKKEHLWMVLAGTMMGLHFMSWTVSLYYTSVASASVLVTVHPIILILVERFWYKIQFATTVWMGVIIAFSGSLLLGYADFDATADFANPTLGNSIALLSAGLFAVYFLIGRRVRQRHNLIEYIFPVYFWAAFISLIVLISFEGFTFPLEKKLLLVGLALSVGPQLIGHGALNFSVRYVSPTLLSTVVLAEPILASILALIIFSELPGLLSLGAMCIILAGVSLTWKKARKVAENISER